MEETLEGGRGPPQAVVPLEREREGVYMCASRGRYFNVHAQLRVYFISSEKVDRTAKVALVMYPVLTAIRVVI
jgi:hypothetical protein